MSQIISKATFDVLLQHLVDLEDQKENLISTYYPTTCDARDEFEQLIKTYIQNIDALITKSKKVDSQDDHCPMVVIGSEVEVEDLAERESYRFLITSPFTEETPSSGERECASCLSPIGRALLLKKENEEVAVHTPVQTFHYRIRAIRLQAAQAN